ncbi:MAG: hypothetical protein Q8920_08585 [Bacillota bacterium]|nr:hypothetical protein [Bacillota bacterium]
MDPKAKGAERWERFKSKGKTRYVLLNGAIGWGIPVGIAASLLDAILDKGFSLKYITSVPFLFRLEINILIFMILGIIYGFYMWSSMRRTYEGKKKRS